MVNPLASLRQEKLRMEKVENVSVPPNTERTLCDLNGPGVVDSLWMSLGGGNAPALDARLRVYYDCSLTSSIDIDDRRIASDRWRRDFAVPPGIPSMRATCGSGRSR